MTYELTDEDVAKMYAVEELIGLVAKHWPNHSIRLKDLDSGKELNIGPVADEQ